jgi:hypothetical protein
MKVLKKYSKYLIQFIIIGFLSLVLFEILYCNSIIDFYKTEANALNNKKDLNSHNIDFLVFGDSFTASADNYVTLLRKEHQKTVFVNRSIPGTGIKQVNTFSKKWMAKYQPKAIIYQVYVGNDLLDVKHLLNWNSLSFSRNVYWKLSDYFLSLTYLNQKSKGLKSINTKKNKTNDSSFSINQFTAREKLLLKADKNYLYKTNTLTDDFLKRYQVWKTAFETFVNTIPKETKVYILFIPHCSQLNDFYYDKFEQLGANFSNKDLYQKNDYSFFNTAKTDFISHVNIQFLNPLEFLKNNDKPNHHLYYTNDSHLNNNGQKNLAIYLNNTIFN